MYKSDGYLVYLCSAWQLASEIYIIKKQILAQPQIRWNKLIFQVLHRYLRPTFTRFTIFGRNGKALLPMKEKMNGFLLLRKSSKENNEVLLSSWMSSQTTKRTFFLSLKTLRTSLDKMLNRESEREIEKTKTRLF